MMLASFAISHLFLFEREFYYGPITFSGGLQPSMVMTRGGTNRGSLCRVRAGSGTEAEIRIGYGSVLPDAGWTNYSKIFSALFKGICRVVAIDPAAIFRTLAP